MLHVLSLLLSRTFPYHTALIALLLACSHSSGAELNALFLGDNGAHQPQRRFAELAPKLEGKGIRLVYTDDLSNLTGETLGQYDALVVYANIDRIDDAYAKAIVNYVKQGGGFVPLHCASFCFRNQPELVALIGAQFQRHGTGVFQPIPSGENHPIMEGFGGFRSWDETYVHTLHNEENRTVLEYRVDEEGREPWTWVKPFGAGRVFYTASGHDSRTWNQPGFQNLVERGIRWAAGKDPAAAGEYLDEKLFDAPPMTAKRTDIAQLQYIDVGPKIPNYTPSRQWGTQGDPKTLMQEPLAAEESIKHFVTPKGFQVQRYADERDFDSKPIAMTWDERGRLWLCETLDYPNELGKNRDRIRICEDTDGDAVADKFTVFAEGLSIPTAIVIVRGGAIVQNGTDTIFLQDTDGDDVADETTTLITGWALGDTHGGVSNFRYGLDNWIWAMQGYNNSRPEYDGKIAQRFRQGFWRFKLSHETPPRVTDLEFVRSSNNNTWGLGISEEGLIFGSTANGNPSMFVPIPNRYYESVRGWSPRTLGSIADSARFEPVTDAVRQVDHHGRYTAGAGHALYTARAFPQQWWNSTAFVCGPTGHLVGTFVLRRDGTDYTSSSPLNLLASDDEWSAPIMAEVGPDGAVWVLDWYNYIVQHNPTPNGFKTGKGAAYESDLRDKRRGRIYRVLPDDTTRLHAYDSLADANNAQLVDALRHPSMRWRLHAQRLLIERAATDSAEQLLALIGDTSVDAIGLNVGAIHALHTLSGLGWIDDEQIQANRRLSSALSRALEHESAGVRRAAISVLPQSAAGLEILLRHDELLSDSDAQVRLQAILSLADMPESDSAAHLIVSLAYQTLDDVTVDALTAAAAAHSTPFLRAVAQSSPATVAVEQITSRVAEHTARGRPNADQLQKVLASLAGADSKLAITILDGLTAGFPNDFAIAENKLLHHSLLKAFHSSEGPMQVKLLRLAGRIGNRSLDSEAEAIVQSLIETLSDTEATEEVRLNAAADLIGFRAKDPDAAREILDTISPQTPPDLAASLISIIRRSAAEEVGELLVETLVDFSPSIKANAITAVLSKPAWAGALLNSAESQQFDLSELSLEQKQALRELPSERLRSKAEMLLARDGGLPDADREKVLQSLLPITKRRGDSDAGLLVFKKACANCHQYGDLGQKIGPNLTGMAVHPKDELLTHIIDPSRSVEGNFRMYKVLTVDGVVVNGMLAGESKTSITIVDAQAKEIDVQREDIEQLVASRKSVMPEGFEKQLSEQELTNLLEFLTDTGPYVPLPLDDIATAISTKGLFSNGDSGPDRMIFADWAPKMVGDVPFLLTDPEGKSKKNIILLNGPFGPLPPQMPKSVAINIGGSVKAIHMLSGVGGWSHPYSREKTISMIVRLRYSDGKVEDHELRNAIHFADYIRRVDVPGSEFAFALGNQQIRYLSVAPKRETSIDAVEFVKGSDDTAPIIMAVTVERND